MHEASLMMNLMHRVEEIARNERAQRIVSVSIWLGALSHISAEHFTEHFERAAAGTPAEGARLDIKVSNDPRHVNAQDVMLENVQVEI
jgi:hydrogenase nickel incorporation protein HypA/HybF